MSKFNVLELASRIPDEASAYRYLEDLRWGDTPVCAHCDGENVTYLNPENGTSRKTRTGAVSQRRVWKCRDCRKQFSVLTNTIMHGTKIPVRTWVFVIYEMCACKNGIAAREIERRYGVTPKSAWFMLHRIREAMKSDGLDLLGGEGHVVVADETFIGGKAKNRHKTKSADAGTPVPIAPGERNPNPVADKTAVLSLIDTETGEVRSRIVPDVTGATLRKAIADQVHMGRSTLHTDQSQSYKLVAGEFAAHETVNHNQDEYVRYTPEGVVTSNQAENFFSQLKRSLDGTHHHVSRKHLSRYLGEFDFRYSTRSLSDLERTEALAVNLTGRRLTYRPLVGIDAGRDAG